MAASGALGLSGREELAHALLGLTDELVHDLRPVYNLRLARSKRACELAREQRLAAAGRAAQQDAAHVRDAEATRRRGVGAAGEHTADNGVELPLQPTHAHLHRPLELRCHARRRRRAGALRGHPRGRLLALRRRLLRRWRRRVAVAEGG